MRWIGRYPLKVFRVRSRTQRHPDTGELIYYDVELWGDGKMECFCIAGKMKRNCYHKEEIKSELVENFGDIFKAISFFRKQKK